MNTTSCQFFAMPVLQDDEQQLFNGNRPNNPLCPLYPSIFPKDSIVKPLEGKRRRSVSMSSASHTWVNLSLGFRSTASISSSVSTSSGVDLRFLLMDDFLCLLLVLSVLHTFKLSLRCASNWYDLIYSNMILMVHRVCIRCNKYKLLSFYSCVPRKHLS